MPAFTDRTWIWLAAACYLFGFALGTLSLLRHRRHSHTWMYGTVLCGFVLQTVGLYLRGLEVKGCPIGNTFEIFQFTAWSATSLYLLIGATFRLSLLGYFSTTLATVMTTVSLAIPAWDASRRVGAFGGNGWIEFHAALALFSYGVFALLALTSVMYLLQVYSLQHRRLSGLFSFLPAIRDLDLIGFRLLLAGTLLMLASLAVGSVYWARDPASVLGPKLVSTVAVGAAYTLALILRLRETLFGKRLAWVCTCLFLCALVSIPLVNKSRKPLQENRQLP